jgi:hypothetical protein
MSTMNSGVGCVELLVRLGERMMLWFINSPEKNVKKYRMFFCCILCYVSDVSIFQSQVRFVLAHKINFGMEKMEHSQN